MNERIDELVKKFAEDFVARSGYDVRGFEPFLVESRLFAELMAREAIAVVQKRFMGDLNREDMEVGRCLADLKKHFGVE